MERAKRWSGRRACGDRTEQARGGLLDFSPATRQSLVGPAGRYGCADLIRRDRAYERGMTGRPPSARQFSELVGEESVSSVRIFGDPSRCDGVPRRSIMGEKPQHVRGFQGGFGPTGLSVTAASVGMRTTSHPGRAGSPVSGDSGPTPLNTTGHSVMNVNAFGRCPNRIRRVQVRSNPTLKSREIWSAPRGSPTGGSD